MKNNRKLMALLLALVMFLTLAGCGSGGGGALEMYSGESAYIEAGYEGDVWNGVAYFLVLNADKTYTLVENTEIIHYGGNVVTYWTYTMSGTYTVDNTNEDEATKTVTLSDATSVLYVMNGSVTSSDEDASLLDYGAGQTVTCSTDTFKITIE